MINAKQLAFDKTLTDEQVVAHVLAGRNEEFEVLIRRYNTLLYRMARGILSDENDIEDAMQEAYLRGFEKLHQYKGEARFSTWLTRILINCSLKQLGSIVRKDWIDVNELGDADMPQLTNDDAELPADVSEVESNLRKALEAAIVQLPPKYRTVFIQREIEHLSTADVAKLLEISEDNVKIRLHRAKEVLRQILRSEAELIEVFRFGGERCDALAARVMKEVMTAQRQHGLH